MVAACPKSCTAPDTWHPVWSVLVDIFKLCLTGDYEGSELAGGWKFCVWSIMGGHDFFSNVLKPPHWRNAMYCWCCKADQTDEDNTGFD